MSDYVQTYDEVSGDAIAQPHPEGGFWWWCEHEGDHYRALHESLCSLVTCEDCGTRWALWEHGGKVRAKAVVVRMSFEAVPGDAR